MKLFLIIILLTLPISSFACMAKKFYVDLSKAKESIEIVADSVVLRHLRALEFQNKMNIKIEEQKTQAPGGLFLYNVFRQSAESISGEITATEIFTKKSFEIKLTIPPQKRGGCSNGKVTYK